MPPTGAASPAPAAAASSSTSTADKHPGAGASVLTSSPSFSSFASFETDWAAVCSGGRTTTTTADADPVVLAVSPDSLLSRGIGDYTVVPGGLLGKGKFSVVYKATKGQTEVRLVPSRSSPRPIARSPATRARAYLRSPALLCPVPLLARPRRSQYAIKHTPLHPHHPLIGARLIREPTILAQLPRPSTPLLGPCLPARPPDSLRPPSIQPTRI